VADRIGQRFDVVKEFDERARPAVDQHERRGVHFPGFNMNEMNGLAVDFDRKVRQLVQLCFLFAPDLLCWQVLAHHSFAQG
jgi:hypothetical protein